MKSRKINILALVTALCSSSAFASTETFSYTTPNLSGNFNDAFTLSSFNTALGTLNSVEIALNLSGYEAVQIFSTIGTPQTFSNATASGTVTVTGPDGTKNSQTLNSGPAISGTALGLTPPAFYNITSFAGTEYTNSISTASATNLSTYENAGSLSFTFAAGNGTYGFTPGNNNGTEFVGGSPNVNGTISVDYNYTPAVVPLPPAIAMFAAGLLGLGASLRRKHQV